jgi:hypothetical protein
MSRNRLLVALPLVSDLLFCAKHLFVRAVGVDMSDAASSLLKSEQDLASIPMAQGGLTRLAISRLKSADVPLGPILKRSGLTPELVADPEERLNVRSQSRF